MQNVSATQPVLAQAPVTPGHGLAIASLVCGIVVIVTGLIPLLFIVVLLCGIVAIVLGFSARRKGRAVGVKQGRAGFTLGIIGTAMAVIGMVIFFSAMNKLDKDLHCLDRAQTTEQINACS